MASPESPIELPEPAGWSTINQGPLASFAGIPGFDPRPLLHQRVCLGGTLYVVRGVETFAVFEVTGKPFGLMVREIDHG